MIKSYRDLIVWTRSIELVKAIYKLTDNFPKSESYGLTSQMRRAAISISSNIAEGKARGTRKDYRHFLLNAFGSGAELETQLTIAKELQFALENEVKVSENLLTEVMKMLNALIFNLKPNT